jgi:uncharacterized protein (TIGR03118 family)
VQLLHQDLERKPIMRRVHQRLLISATASTAICALTVAYADSDDSAYVQTNLVSNLAGQAKTQDPSLKNPWGIAFFPGAPFWISDNHAGVSTLYDGQGNIIPLVVQIPGPEGSAANTTAAPTGVVWNPTQGFAVAPNLPALFIFATEDGTISGWNQTADAKHAVLKADNSQAGAVYKGLALGSNTKGVFLFATNFHAATIDVFDNTFKQISLDGTFSDPGIPAGYAPFGITLIDGNLFVTYAQQDAAKHDDVQGAGHGFVNVFDTDGHLLRRFATGGPLNSPWGLTRSSYGFGRFSGDVLVGNFGDGHISAYSSQGRFLGQLRNAQAQTIVLPGLWGLRFGGALGSSPDTLYFTAGINNAQDGLFGSIQAVTVTVTPH